MIIQRPISTHDLPSPSSGSHHHRRTSSNISTQRTDNTTNDKKPPSFQSRLMAFTKYPPDLEDEEEQVGMGSKPDWLSSTTTPDKVTIYSTKERYKEDERHQESSFIQRAPRVSFSTVQVRTHAVEYDTSDLHQISWTGQSHQHHHHHHHHGERRGSVMRSISCPRLGRTRTLGWTVVCEDQTYSVDNYKTTQFRRHTVHGGNMMNPNLPSSSAPVKPTRRRRSQTFGAIIDLPMTTRNTKSITQMPPQPLDKSFDRWAC